MEYKVFKNFEEMYQDLRHPKYISHPVKGEKPKKASTKKSSKKKENE